MQKVYCILWLFFIILQSTTRAVPLRYRRAFSYIANETACTVDHIVYKDGDPIPTDDPCESCKCRPPGFSCVLRECEVKTGCKAIRRAGECCPQYQCGCEHNGNYYGDGDRIPNAESPCYSCYCQGSSITCSLADCKFRFDCEPEYVLGECCPRYDHCPPEHIPTSVTVKSTAIPLLTTLFTRSTTPQLVTTTPIPTTTTPLIISTSPLSTTTTLLTTHTTPLTTNTTPLTTNTTPLTANTTPLTTITTPLTTNTTPLTTNTTPLTTNTTPLTTNTIPYTRISSTTPSTTTVSTIYTTPIIITGSSSNESTTLTEVDITKTTEPLTTSSSPATITSALPTTSPDIITINSQTTFSSIAIDSGTSSSVMKEQTTTLLTSESETLVPSEPLTDSVTKIQALPEFTNFPTTESAQSSSKEYSTIGIINESSETNPTTEFSINAQTNGIGFETSSSSDGTSPKSIETSGPLSETITTTIKLQTTTQTPPESGSKVGVTQSITPEIVTEVKVDTTSKEIITEIGIATISPEDVNKVYETTTDSPPQTTVDSIVLVTETVVASEETTKQTKDEIIPSEKITTEAMAKPEATTAKTAEEEREVTTQKSTNEENFSKIENLESTPGPVFSESSTAVTTLSPDLEVSKTEAITIIAPQITIEPEKPKEQPNHEVMPTEKPAARLPTITFAQTIGSEMTTPSVKDYETTTEIKWVKNEENPETSPDSMVEIVTPDLTIVKSDQISTSNEEQTTSQMPKETSITEQEFKESATKEPMTTPYPTVKSDSQTTKTVSGSQSFVTETIKPEEFTTRMSDEKIEVFLPEESKTDVNLKETTTETTLKVFVDINDDMTTVMVANTNIQLNNSQNMVTKSSNEDNVITSPLTTTKQISNQSSESTTLKTIVDSDSETTVYSKEMTSESDRNKAMMESETTVSSKQMGSINNSEPVTPQQLTANPRSRR